MNLIGIWLFCCLLVTLVARQEVSLADKQQGFGKDCLAKRIQPPVYDLTKYSASSLTLVWLGQVCTKYKGCVTNWNKKWDTNRFTVQGFQPYIDRDKFNTLLISSYKTCPDPDCDTGKYFFEEVKDSKIGCLEDDLQKYWYDFDNTLIQQQALKVWYSVHQQWNVHGVCYQSLIKKQYSEQFTDEDIFKAYYEQTLKKTKQFSQRLKKHDFDSKLDLAQMLGIQTTQFRVECDLPVKNRCQILKLRICYNLARPGQEQLTDCPKQWIQPTLNTLSLYIPSQSEYPEYQQTQEEETKHEEL